MRSKPAVRSSRPMKYQFDLLAPKPWTRRTGVSTGDVLAAIADRSSARPRSAHPNGQNAAVTAVEVASRTCARYVSGRDAARANARIGAVVESNTDPPEAGLPHYRPRPKPF